MRRTVAATPADVTRPAEGQVKSAGRVLDILEFFAANRKPATIQQVASALNFPHSSATALLNSMHRRGYLDYEPRQRTFVTANKTLQLTGWLADSSTQVTRLQGMLQSLQEDTGETVILATRHGGTVRYDQVVPSAEILRVVLQPGTVRPLHRTAAGIVLLAGLPEDERHAAVRLSVALERARDGRTQTSDTLKLAEVAAQRGWHESRGRMLPGLSVIAARLQDMSGHESMAVGIGGPEARIAANRDAILSLLERATGRLLARSGRRRTGPSA